MPLTGQPHPLSYHNVPDTEFHDQLEALQMEHAVDIRGCTHHNLTGLPVDSGPAAETIWVFRYSIGSYRTFPVHHLQVSQKQRF